MTYCHAAFGRRLQFCLSLSAVLLVVGGCGKKQDSDAPPATVRVWSEEVAPQITYAQAVPSMVWNDPCVVKEGSEYRMWLSGGDGGSANPNVRVYEATSSNGVAWTIGTTAEVSEGASGEWDSQRIETPMVVKVGATYHLYYSGGTAAEVAVGRYRLGHATSPDGTTWTKDPANPILTYHADSDPLHWGFYTTAEPGVVYDATTGIFYLYYVTVKSRPGYTGDLGGMYGIALATSTDGSTFTHYDADMDGFDDVVLEQTSAYPVSSLYVGYSTPFATIDSAHVFHLYYDVVQYPNPGDFRQVALAHATSTDGIHFTEVETDISTNGGSSWHRWEIRAPSVLQEGSTYKMWFAGHSAAGDPATTGIGYATSTLVSAVAMKRKESASGTGDGMIGSTCTQRALGSFPTPALRSSP